MNFGNDKGSSHYQDDTVLTRLMKLLYMKQANDEQDINDKMNDLQSVGGYSKWITGEMNKLSPDDLHTMKNNGMTIQDLYVLKAMQRGQRVPEDPSVSIYKR
jgi:hypothetical protein